MDRKRRQRSVGIQSTDGVSEPAAELGRLCKKAGFRNLLQKSVTIVAQDTGDGAETSNSPRERASKSVQASMDHEFQNPRLKTVGHFGGFPNFKRRSSGKDDDSRKSSVPSSEMMKLFDRRTDISSPGTSRAQPAAYTSHSMESQMNEMYLRPQEGSLAVVYSYGEKPLATSRSSNLGFFYGSQGSRRYSDETVLLIEDYQSYDYTNAARRQETESSPRRSFFGCCRRSKRMSEQLMTRPLPLEYENIEEKDEFVVCRICHEGEDVEPLIEPCLCKGSVGSVHAKCLKIWLEQSNTSRCELCNYPFAIRQTKKYSKWVSIRVFFKSVVDRRAMAYDVISFVVITPLTLVGVAMCIQASVYSGDTGSNSGYKMGNITRVGMFMLSGTIAVAYSVWMYTLIAYYYKSWKKWYNNCYDVEVIPIKMTSQDRLEAARRLSEEISRRQQSRERGSALVTVLHSPTDYSSYQRRPSVPSVAPPVVPPVASPVVQLDR